MSRTVLSKIFKILLLFVFVIPCGCAHRYYYKPDYTQRYYVPKQIPLKPGMILKPEFNVIKSVNLINTQANTEDVLLGAYTHKWWGNLKMWTDTAVGLTKSELEKREVAVIEGLSKTLKLSITRANLVWKFRVVECMLNLNVETGDGYAVNFEVTNASTDLYDSCDGTVTKAVAAMFCDDGIRNYLRSPVVMEDSDCDGVPDYLDECPGTPVGVQVDSKGCPLDSDGDGVPDYLDECPGTPKGVKVDSKGCPLDSDGDGVLDYLDKCPGTPKGARVDERGCWVSDTLFDFNRYEIKLQYYPVLDEVVVVLKENPYLKIKIQGHADIIGTKAYNQKLSEMRAKAVMEYLASEGIEPTRLSSVGYGFSRPKATNETEAGRSLNRRVEFVPVH